MYYLFNRKTDFFKTYLNDNYAELGLNGKIYKIDFEIENYTCIYNSMKFTFFNEFMDDIQLEGQDLEKHGIDLDLIEYIHEEINDDIRFWFEENYTYDPDEDIDDWFDRKIQHFNC